MWPPKPNEFDSAGAGSHGASVAVDDVEMDLGVGLLVAGRGRDVTAVDAQGRGHGLDGAGPAQGVTGDSLDGGDGGRGRAEHLLDGLGLGQVVERGRGSVGVDVPDLGGGDPSVVEGELHARCGPIPPGSGGGDVVGIGRRRRTEQLGVDAAPRRRAWSSSSRTSAAPPSAQMKPSRLASKGRDFPSLDKAVMLPKAARPIPTMAASAPPPMDTSQRPDATRRPAAAMAWVPAAQAVVMVSQGPCHPARMETWAAPALAIIMGTRNGETRRAPLSWNTSICSWSVSSPPTPVPKITPEPIGVDADLAGVDERHVGGGHRELREAVHTPHVFGAEPSRGVEVGHTAFAVGRRVVQTVPEVVEADPAARHDAHAGDDHAPAPRRALRADPEEHQSLAEMRS